MEELQTTLIQTGFNLDRLKEDGKIDEQAYIVLKKRNEIALNLYDVSKRCLADIEIEYKHPTGKKKGKLKYDDDDETLILDYKGGFITLPNIEDCNVC